MLRTMGYRSREQSHEVLCYSSLSETNLGEAEDSLSSVRYESHKVLLRT